MNKIIQFSFFSVFIFLAFIFSVKSISGNESGFYSWYENYLMGQKEEEEHMDAQLFGKPARDFILRGLVLESDSRKGVSKAVISVYSSSQKMLSQIKTDEKGFFDFSKESVEKQSVRIEIKAKGYATFNRFVDILNPVQGLEFQLLKAGSATLGEGDFQTIEDPEGFAQLKVYSNVLKRLDGKKIIFPVQIQLSYINPETRLVSMPGLMMLTQEANLVSHPLTSSGAVLIDAADSTGAQVRIDREKEKQTGLTTELIIRTKNGKIPQGTTGWEFDAQRGDYSWKNSKAVIEQQVNNNLQNKNQMPLSSDFLLKYAKDVADRINLMAPGSQGAGNGCADGNYFSVDRVSYNSQIKPDVIYENLLTYMAEDLVTLTGKPRSDFCLDVEYSSFYTYGCQPWLVYDALVLSEQKKSSPKLKERYKAGNYLCDSNKDDRSNYLIRPNDLTSGFDYTPLLKLQATICQLLNQKKAETTMNRERKNWENAIAVKSLDLVPFNLDKPWNGVPISVQLKENNGDGTFKVILKMKTEFGNYETEHFLNSGKNPVNMNILIPDGNKLEILVKTRLNGEKWKLAKEIKLPAATSSYKWSSGELRELVTTKGEKPNWIKLEPIFFDE